jgi:hypothetical protein
MVANAVAGELGVTVSGVFAPSNIALAKERLDFSVAHIDQRADQALGRDRMNAGESSEARAPQQAEENGLGLIVTSVAQGDAVGGAVANQAREKLAASPAGGLFQVIVHGADLSLGAIERQAYARGNGRDEGFVLVRRRPAQLVIEVDDSGRHYTDGDQDV